MNNSIKFLALAAIAAGTLSACVTEINPGTDPVDGGTLHLIVTPEVEEPAGDVRSYIDDNKTIRWSDVEKMMIGLNGSTPEETGEATIDPSENKASFPVDITDVTPAESYNFYGFYPSAARVVDNSNVDPAAYKVLLPAAQNATASSYDPAAYILVSKPHTAAKTDIEGHDSYTWSASYRRATALNDVTLKNLDADIKSVKFTFPEGTEAAGERVINLTTGESGAISEGASNTVEVNYETALPANGGADKHVWFTSWSTRLAQGDKLKVEAKTSSSAYVREITANAKGINFVQGYLNTLGINMAPSVAPKQGVGDEYTWTLASGDLGTTESPASQTEKGTPLLTWTPSFDWNNAYLGWDSNSRGVQIGSSSKNCNSVVLRTSEYVGYVKNVTVNSSLASSTNGTLSVSVGGKSLTYEGNTTADLSSTATDYTFVSPVVESGEIVITITKTTQTAKALYLKSIAINSVDDRTDPKLEFAEASYPKLLGADAFTPVLKKTTGFDGELTYALSQGGEHYTPGDNDFIAKVSDNGVITVGNQTGEVTLTASFDGDDNFKPSSASCTIIVSEPFLTLSDATTPAKASYTDGSVTFDVTSNVDWTAEVGTDEGNIIKSVTASGNTVTVSFNNNTSTLQRSATVTVTPTEPTYASLAKSITVTQEGKKDVDVLTLSVTGVEAGSTTYSDFTNKSYAGGSTAVYSGKVAGSYSAIQLNNGSNRGIFSTVSGGTLSSVEVAWEEHTTTGRTLNVYGRNTAYESASVTQSELIGTIVCGTSTKLEVSGSYEYILLTSASGAMYLDEIRITWTPAKPASDIAWKFGDNVATEGEGTITYGATTETAGAPTFYNPNNIASGISFESSDEDVATVSEAGEVTIVGAGTTTLTATFAGNDDYRSGTATYALTVADITERTITAAGFTNEGSLSFTVGDNTVTQAKAGDEVTVTATPVGDYVLTALSWKETGATGDGTNILATKTFTMPAAPVTVKATFEESSGATQLDPPGNPTISAISATGFTATWTAPTNGVVQSYDWKLTTTADGTGTAAASGTAEADATSVTASNLTLTANTDYYFHVKAVGDGSTSTDSPFATGGKKSFIDWSKVYTSNVTLTAGTNGSECTVSGNYGIKVGTSSKGGDMSITVPSGKTKLYIHAAAWNNVNGLSLNISGATVSPASISLISNSGISNNSPFTFSGDASTSSYFFEITLPNSESATTLKFTTSINKRFVIWGCNAE